MKIRVKILLLCIISIIASLGAFKYADFVRERYVYRFINSKLENYANLKLNARLSIGRIKGNVFTNLELEDVLLKGLRNCPEELELACESIKLSYSPLKIFSGELNIEFESPKITYKGMFLPLDIYHRGRVTTVTFKNNFTKIEDIKEILPRDVYLTGPVGLEGEIILKNFSAHIIDVRVKSRDCCIGFEGSLKARGRVKLEVNGSADNPQISGDVDLRSIQLTNGFSGLSLFKSQTADIKSEFLKKAVVNINVSGKSIAAKDRYINTFLDMNLNLRKERGEEPYFMGRINIEKGTYQAFDNKFEIAKGNIVFLENDQSPSVDVEAETKIRRYKIFATVKGTLDNSRLVLFSKPELSRADITSLLVFGKRINDLSTLEKRELTKKDFDNTLINNFFFGKAEAALAKIIGVDDINIQFNRDMGVNSDLKPASVEVGKYIVDQKLYGSYKIEPHMASGSPSEQALKGELELNDNITIEGERHWRQSWHKPKEDRVDIAFKWKF